MRCKRALIGAATAVGLVGGMAVTSQATVSTAGATTPSAVQPIGVPGTWNLTFDDEFNAPGVSPIDSQWTNGWFPTSSTGTTNPVNASETACYSPSHAYEAFGVAALYVSNDPCKAPNGTTYPHTGALINTDPSQGGKGFQQAYGYFEARIYTPGWPQGFIANWPAFLTEGQNVSTDGEIGIFEGLNYQANWQLHWPGIAGGVAGGVDHGGGYTSDAWHIVGVAWQSGTNGSYLTYYLDGHDVGAAAVGPASGAPHYLVLDDTVGSTGGAAPGMYVDYVRAWSGSCLDCTEAG